MSAFDAAQPFFIVDLTYLAPLERIDALLAGHTAFLKEGYETGRFIFSGPKDPRTGGVIVATAESLADIEAFLATDPFHKAGAVEYRITAFTPKMKADWIS